MAKKGKGLFQTKSLEKYTEAKSTKSNSSLSSENLAIIAAVLVLLGDAIALFSLLQAQKENGED